MSQPPQGPGSDQSSQPSPDAGGPGGHRGRTGADQGVEDGGGASPAPPPGGTPVGPAAGSAYPGAQGSQAYPAGAYPGGAYPRGEGAYGHPGGPAGAPPGGGRPPGAGPSYLSQFEQGGFADKAGGGFFGALFDLSFTRFVTPYILRFVFVLAIVIIGLGVLLGFLGGLFALFAGEPSGVLFVVLAPLLGLLYLLVVRLLLEATIAVIRIAQNSTRIVEHLDRR